MKLATWNVNSVRARLERLLAWLQKAQPDILCLQELKTRDDAFPHDEIRKAGYHATVFGQKTFNGVGILSRIVPHNVLGAADLFGEALNTIVAERDSACFRPHADGNSPRSATSVRDFIVSQHDCFRASLDVHGEPLVGAVLAALERQAHRAVPLSNREDLAACLLTTSTIRFQYGARNGGLVNPRRA